VRLVLVESPYKAPTLAQRDANVAYARAAMRDCLLRGEAPLASHLLYTQPDVLDDADEDERALGIHAGLEWGSKAAATVVYTDRGTSTGMQIGIARARSEGREVEFRSLPAWRAP
jgi:hypothetical protein